MTTVFLYEDDQDLKYSYSYDTYDTDYMTIANCTFPLDDKLIIVYKRLYQTLLRYNYIDCKDLLCNVFTLSYSARRLIVVYTYSRIA